MFLEVLLLGAVDQRLEDRRAFGFARADDRDLADIADLELHCRCGPADIGRVMGRVGEQDERRFQSLGAVDGHHADRVRRGRGVAFHFDIALAEPGEEAVERGDFFGFEGQRVGDELGDRVAGGFAQTPQQLGSPPERAREDGFEEVRGHDEIGLPQPFGENRVGLL